MQLALVTVKQLPKGVAVAGDVGCEKLGVTAFFLTAFRETRIPDTHGRTLTNRCPRGTSPTQRL
jgi:hypothetical protein